jgi:hypothetical protein
MNNFTLASPPIPNIKFLSFVVGEKCVILKICTLFPKPYIFMIRVTREIKLHYSSGPRDIPHPLPKVNFLMVEIPTLKPYIFMIMVTSQIKCLIAQAPGSYLTPYLK